MSMSAEMNMGSGEDQRMEGPHTDAHTTIDSMSMAADMDMTLDQSNSMAGTDTNLDARLGHSMAMPPQPESVTETLGRTAKAEMGATASLNQFRSLRPCMHEPCSQNSMSVSPPTGDHSQPKSVVGMPTDIFNPLNFWTAFQWIKSGPPPPTILAVDCLTTTLRI
jgi:hypothetical protein